MLIPPKIAQEKNQGMLHSLRLVEDIGLIDVKRSLSVLEKKPSAPSESLRFIYVVNIPGKLASIWLETVNKGI